MPIKIKDTVKSPWNVRKEYLEETVSDLADSISKEGMVSRIVVRESKGGKYEILAGGRRVEALKHLYGEDHEIEDEHLVLKEDMTDFEALNISISENVQRISFSSIELAEAAEKVKALKPGIPVKDIAKMLWISSARTKRLLGVAKDLEDIPGRAREELALPDESEPLFTDAHWDAVSKGSSNMGEEQVREVCDFIMDKEIPSSRVGEVLKRFEEVEEVIDGNDPAESGEPKPEDPFEEKYNGELRLREEEDGRQVVYVCGKKEDVPLEIENILEYLKNPESFKVYLTAKLKIKPLEP
jgi:ParB/RepB/Spo0J family partition protein